MVRSHDLRLLHRLHETNEAVGLEELSTRFGTRRSVYRWMARIRKTVTYQPRVAFAAMGLVHVHLFIRRPAPEWFAYPYAIDRAWMIDQPGRDVLYLHCLLPSEHAATIPRSARITAITTGDGWQTLAPLHEALDVAGRPVVRNAQARLASWNGSRLDQLDPFVVPVACELQRPRSMHEHWRVIKARLGERVWEYFPRRTRRWQHNGKAYVRQACEYLNQYGLVLQHTITYHPLAAHTIELFLLTTTTTAVRDALASTCPTVETYQAGKTLLVRVRGNEQLLKRLISTGGVRRWWFVDEERTTTAPAVRFQYEHLFDPRTRSWVHD